MRKLERSAPYVERGGAIQPDRNHNPDPRSRIWGPNQEELAEPGDLAGRECKVRCELRQVWVMSNQCGLLLEVTDLQLKAYEAAGPVCPF